MIYRCENCGFEGHCYGIATNQGVSAPFCSQCQLNNKLVRIDEECEEKP